jgi:DNA-binding XRE family transcriptional regulator
MGIREQEKKSKEEWLKAFGNHVKKVRLTHGLTGAELARQLFMDKPNITRIEKGRVNPSVYLVQQICKVCGISIQEFWKSFE